METEGREGYTAYSPRPKDQCFLIKAVFKTYYIKLPALLNAWRLRQRIVQIQDFFLLKTFHIFKKSIFFKFIREESDTVYRSQRTKCESFFLSYIVDSGNGTGGLGTGSHPVSRITSQEPQISEQG